MSDAGIVQHTLEPWFDSASKVLILGTIPSVMSRKQHCYYGHPQNRFWPTVAAVFGESVPCSVEERRAFCLRHGIALWDVLASCEIAGSEDASIRKPVANDISWILHQTHIVAIFTTGQKAKQLYDTYVYPVTGREAIALPSTSPANRRWANEETLFQAYRAIAMVD